jgi:hypothetical protein
MKQSFPPLCVEPEDGGDLDLVRRDVEPFCELVDIIRGIVDEHFGDTVVKDGLIGSTESCQQVEAP